MLRLSAVLATAACVAVLVSAVPINYCDPGFECKWTYQDIGHLKWTFDFSGLCKFQDTIINDLQNHTYYLNVCGISHKKCNPQWDNTYQYGAAVQMWGDPPPCNLSDSSGEHCFDKLTGAKECCTRNCQVLGVGEPLWKPLDPVNPFDGGVSITHFGVPPSQSDPFSCPSNPRTGQQEDRRVTYQIMCDPTMAPNDVVPVFAGENVTQACQYIIVLKSSNACGCAPSCDNRNCGDDGCGSNCGSKDGGCPFGYQCDQHQVCCKPDCTNRECGADGCGGFCGPLNGACPKDKPICMNTKICGGIPTPLTVYKTSGGGIAGAFFGGLFGAIALGAVGMFFYKRRDSYIHFGGSSGSGPGGAVSSSSAAFIGTAHGSNTTDHVSYNS